MTDSKVACPTRSGARLSTDPIRILEIGSIARRIAALALVALLGPAITAAAAQGVRLGFEEEFALATDRAPVLAKLVPGTEDYYFYHCLDHQHGGRLDAVPALLEVWIQRYGRGARVEEIENRQALLLFDRDPAATYAFLQNRLGLSFAHQRELPGEGPVLPSSLDQALIADAALLERALQWHPSTTDGLRGAALARLAASGANKLDERVLMSLLQRLDRPDLPGLADLVVRNLADRQSRGFGSLAIHRQLLLAQLEQCAVALPALLGQGAFVETWLLRLAPSDDIQWQRDRAARLAYLERLEAFAKRLPDSFNSLEAHVLYHRLAYDLETGALDAARLRTYLQLPRRSPFAPRRMLEKLGPSDQQVDLNAQYATGLAAIGNDEPLVRAYLAELLRGADSHRAFADVVDEKWLERLFAETKILAGLGDMERWYSLLDDPVRYEELEQRVDLQFPATQRTVFGVDEPVAIALDVKNVETLLVKVFEINALNYYAATAREIDASIDLEGIVANQEATHTYAEPPLRRVRRNFEFPQLVGPGVWVVEFIGNGKASRAVIHKGGLQIVERTGAAGHVFRVFDERGELQRTAEIQFAGRRYASDASGEISLPFTTDPGSKKLVVEAAGRTSLQTFRHRAEQYELRAGFYVDREALRAGDTARVVVRPLLLANGHPAALVLLEDAVLSVRSRDQRGNASSLELRDLELDANGELVRSISVPADLATLELTLRGRVRNLSRGEDQNLEAASQVFAINAIDPTVQTTSPLLGRTPQGWYVDVRGKSGEPRAGVPLWLRLEHADYTDPIDVTLLTDTNGRVQLGALAGITTVQASGVPGGFGPWRLDDAARTQAAGLHGVQGETLRVPYLGSAARATRANVSLIETRRGAPLRDAFEHVALEGGYFELKGLTAGNYVLRLLESGFNIDVRVTAGEARGGFAVGRDRMLELGDAKPLHVIALRPDADGLSIELGGASPQARVHVFATRYAPGFDVYDRLRVRSDDGLAWLGIARIEAEYRAERDIGDEFRYILERRLARTFPGNMLARPGLILNPWALEETSTSIGLGGGGGGAFGGRSGGARDQGRDRAEAGRADLGPNGSTFANLDFLPASTPLLANLRPGADGRLRVALGDLGQGRYVHVVAVDGDHTVRASLALPEVPLVPRDRRLAEALDPARHFGQYAGIEPLLAGEAVTLEAADTTSAETYETLADVFALFRTLSGNGELAQFAPLVEWPTLTDEERRAAYSKLASHEVHYFLHEKDPAFFEAVVRPYLANKAHKTFLDLWLLDADLSAFAEPWAFARLNVFERILLTRRLEGRAADGQRHLRELFELLPPTFVTATLGIDVALAATGLQADRKLSEELRSKSRNAEKPGEGAAAPGRAARPSADAATDGEDVAESENDELAALGYLADKLERGDDRQALLQAEAAKDLAGRELQREYFRPVVETRAWVENDYWHVRLEAMNADLVGIDGFWADFAANSPDRPFVSAAFTQATSNLTEMLLALAVLDLPFTAGEHTVAAEGSQRKLTAASPLLIVRREVRELATLDDARPVLVSQDFFRLDDRYTYDGGVQLDKFVESEFLIDVVYGCRVVATNPTSAPRELELLLQVPAGALPVQLGSMTRGERVRLEPFGTTTFEYAFYFPRPGEFAHYPVHVSEQGATVAFAAADRFEVLLEPRTVDTTSWEYVSQRGTNEQVLGYLRGANLARLDLSRIAWRMRERATYDAVLGLLRDRFRFDPTLWSYGIRHRDARGTREWLRYQDGFVANCGRSLESPLLVIDPIERRWYQHIEFDPLVNGRAHRFGRQRELLNRDVARQYLALLDTLAYRPVLDDDDWMAVTYYLLLQDRVLEALECYARIDPSRIETKLQYDYLTAYTRFFTGDRESARSIAESHRDHPVERWRGLFRAVLAQLDEAEGRTSVAVDETDREQRQGDLALSEPAVDVEVVGRTVELTYRNVATCEVNYYPMDVEFLFSTSPFVQQGSGSFSYVRPKRSDVIALAADAAVHSFELPAEYRNANLLLEVRAGGIVRRETVFAGALAVQWMENYGQVRVTRTGTDTLLPGVYVKVFAKLPSGQVRFHKDGYTDLRGRFDYASLSGTGANDAVRYAVLVLSPTDGAVVRELDPPAR